MKITFPKNWDDMSLRDRTEFLSVWSHLNKNNLDFKVDNNIVTIYSKGEQYPLASFEAGESLDYYETLASDDAIDFNIRFTGNVGDKMYLIIPDIDAFNGAKMKFTPDNIVECTITRLSGASDLDCTLDAEYIQDEEVKKICCVQTAFFETREEAEEACSKIPENGVDTWDEYNKLVGEAIKYRYKANLSLKRGSKVFTKMNGETTLDRENRSIWSEEKVYRAVISNFDGRIIFQTVGSLFSSKDKRFISNFNGEDVIVKKEGHKFKSYIGDTEVITLCSNYSIKKSEYSIVKIGE